MSLMMPAKSMPRLSRCNPGALPSTRWQDFPARVALAIFGVRLPIDYRECIPTRAADLNPTENEY
jgi:hypothetical protein